MWHGQRASLAEMVRKKKWLVTKKWLQEGLEFEARAREFMFLWPPAQDVASSSERGSI